MIKEYWFQLATREKQTIMIGGFFAFLFLFYFLIWSPFTSKVENLKNTASSNAVLLKEMQEIDQKINFLQKNSISTHGSSLSILQNAIQQSSVAKNLTDMQQKEKDSVQLYFKEVDFDQLITWLINNSSEGWTISEFSTTKTSKPGMVSARFQLRL